MKTVDITELEGLVEREKIEVFICSASFEERCFSIATVLKGYSFDDVIVFYNDNEDTSIIENANVLAEILSPLSQKVKLDSDNPVQNFAILYSKIEIIANKNISYKFLIDCTTFTHETLLILLKIFELILGSFDNVFVCYVGASEYSFNTNNEEDKWLSKGIKQIRTILGYPGYMDPTKKNHLIVLFGFESERTRMLIDSYEFNAISLGFAESKESIQDNHQAINERRHREILLEYPNAYSFSFSCLNPFHTKKTILDLVDQFADYNSVIAPMNNKISTIGVGLAGMDNFDLQITYAKPNIYNSLAYSKPNKTVFFFNLEKIA
jgi:hypothetical protein